MIVNRSAPPGPIVPRLVYEDVAKAIVWLCQAFGFTERLRTPPEPDDTIHHAQLAVGEGSVILTGQPGDPAIHPQSLYVKVEDVDAHFAHAREFKAKILMRPETFPFGERQYSAEDHAGYRWTFSQSVADVKPEDWGAKVTRIVSPLALLPRPRLCYLEIPAVDLQQSVAFYESVFGWNIRHRDSGRPSFDDATGHVSGAWVTGRPASREPGLLIYIWVDSIDTTLKQIAAHGGEIVDASHLDSPGGEWIATFRDPGGNQLGLYQEG
jgi:predicted enzyme related to lactoylglutathione lyase